MSNSLISSSHLLKSALSLAANEIYVLPVKTDKTPFIKNWQNDASKNPKVINEWWSEWPTANIGIHTGKSKLVVIDIDPRNGGDKSFNHLIETYGKEWLSKFKVNTGGGGTHFYYAEPYHQQYLAKNPNGYCGLKGTGVCLTD